MEYFLNAANQAVAQNGAGVWRRFNTKTGGLSSFAAAPDPGAQAQTWTPPARPANPVPQLAPQPAPAPQQQQPPPRLPAQPMSGRQKFGAIVAIAIVAIVAMTAFGDNEFLRGFVLPPSATETAATATPEKVRALEVEVVPTDLQKMDHKHVLQDESCEGHSGKAVKVDSGKKNARGKIIWDYYRCR
ncbi:hypothetical protein A3H74_00885 [Candidatus Kaiserbacteria bacterium RIFCSPLOWO2_02_FULL_51_13]|nr:MAG: hypothetical protein A3H74_00885 [Candidatus Kaiserbacteria bacterium RIFCSPLOWO2_02_FULL_51_13]